MDQKSSYMQPQPTSMFAAPVEITISAKGYRTVTIRGHNYRDVTPGVSGGQRACRNEPCSCGGSCADGQKRRRYMPNDAVATAAATANINGPARKLVLPAIDYPDVTPPRIRRETMASPALPGGPGASACPCAGKGYGCATKQSASLGPVGSSAQPRETPPTPLPPGVREVSLSSASSSVKGHAGQRKLPFQPTLSRVGAAAPIDGVRGERVPIHSGTITHEDPPAGLNCPIVRRLEDAQQRCARGIYDDLQAAYSPPNPADYGPGTHWETCRDLAGELTNLNLVWLSDYPNRLQSECGVDWETAIGIAQRSFGPDVTYCPGVTYPDSDLDVIARNRHQGGWHPPDGVWAEGCSATIDPRYEVDVRRAILWSYLRRLGLHERPRACLYPECPDPNRSVCEACCDFNGGGGECKADCCGGLR